MAGKSTETWLELEQALSGLLQGLNVDLVDVELRQANLVVTVTRNDGLDLESLSSTARAVSDFLDANEGLTPEGPYELEVSSPGLERRLRRPEHFRRALGALIAVRTVSGTPGDRRVTGTLTSADDAGIAVTLSADEKSKDAAVLRELRYVEIDRAHTVFDWKSALAADKRARVSTQEDTSKNTGGPRAKQSQQQPPTAARARER